MDKKISEEDLVVCRICGVARKTISKHLRSKHNLTSKEYIEKYSSPVMTRSYFEALSNCRKGNKNGMFGSSRCGKENPFFGKHHSEETKEKLKKGLFAKGENHYLYGKGYLMLGELNPNYGPNPNLVGEKNPFFGKHHSPELIKKMQTDPRYVTKGFSGHTLSKENREIVRKNLKEKWKDPAFRELIKNLDRTETIKKIKEKWKDPEYRSKMLNKIRNISTPMIRSKYINGYYKGIRFDSSYELKFLRLMDIFGIHCIRATDMTTKYYYNNSSYLYFPDFYCFELNCVFELKGYLVDKDNYKFEYFKLKFPSILHCLVMGKELSNLFNFYQIDDNIKNFEGVDFYDKKHKKS